MAKNLFKLAHYYDIKKYGETALQMLKNIEPEIEKYPSGYSNWLDLLENYRSNFYEVVVVGEDALEKVQSLNKKYLPNKIIAGNTNESEDVLLKGRYVENQTLIYVCVNNTCKLPVQSTVDAIKSID